MSHSVLVSSDNQGGKWGLVLTLFDSVKLELPAEDDESSANAQFARAYRAIEAKNYNEALEACEKAIELGCSRPYQAYALNLLGTFNFLKGNNQSALEYFNKSIEADPKFVQSYIKRSSLYMEQGERERNSVHWLWCSMAELLAVGDIATALKQFDDALAINPSDPDIYYHRYDCWKKASVFRVTKCLFCRGQGENSEFKHNAEQKD